MNKRNLNWKIRLLDRLLRFSKPIREFGNQVQFTEYTGMIHGFLSFPPFCRGALPAFLEIATYVKKDKV